MSRGRPPRIPQRHGPKGDPHAHQWSMARTQRLHPKLRQKMCKALNQDLQDFKTSGGLQARKHWNSLALALSIADMLACMDICSDIESREAILGGFEALTAVRQRGDATNTWAMRAEEMTLLELALERHRIQLQFCSCGEYQAARERVIVNNHRAHQQGVQPGSVRVMKKPH